MSINKKIYIIQENKSAAIAAINSYLDYIYSLHEMFFDEDGNLKDGLPPDKNAEELIQSSKTNADKFELVRNKLIGDDFNLSTTEMDYIGLAFYFVHERMTLQIKNLERAKSELSDLVEILFDGESQELKEIINLNNQ